MHVIRSLCIAFSTYSRIPVRRWLGQTKTASIRCAFSRSSAR